MEKPRQTRRPWSTLEVRFLLENAGKLPVSGIAKQLKRSEAAIRAKTSKLKKDGYDISLKHYESKLVWCPTCATWRSKLFKRTGECRVCRTRDRLQRNERRCQLAIDALPADKRAQYLTHSRGFGGSLPTKPPYPRLEGKTIYESNMLQEQYILEIENWETACLLKRINAAKTRLMRIRRKYDNTEQ